MLQGCSSWSKTRMPSLPPTCMPAAPRRRTWVWQAPGSHTTRPCTQVRTPAIKWEATSRRVLTMEWIEGVKLTDKVMLHGCALEGCYFCENLEEADLGAPLLSPGTRWPAKRPDLACSSPLSSFSPRRFPRLSRPLATLPPQAAMARSGLSVVQFVDVGIECSLRQLLEHGFFHADPHPGTGQGQAGMPGGWGRTGNAGGWPPPPRPRCVALSHDWWCGVLGEVTARMAGAVRASCSSRAQRKSWMAGCPEPRHPSLAQQMPSQPPPVSCFLHTHPPKFSHQATCWPPPAGTWCTWTLA